MDRRRFLGLAATGLLAGCAGLDDPDGTPSTPERATGRRAGSRFPESLPVAREALVRAAPRDAIPAITDPAFAPDWSDYSVRVRTQDFGVRTVHPRLADTERVIGVVRGGEARAYPLRVLVWHEAVNDAFRPDSQAEDEEPTATDDDTGGHRPLLVTYCPLCGSGVVVERVVDGDPLVFGVSGLLWRDNLVLYDRATGSLWSQVAATAVRGPLTGTTLPFVPSTLVTWGAWRREHPDTRVLVPPPASATVRGRGSAAVRDYTFDPYGAYETNDRVGVGGRTFEDDRLPPKTRVLGVVAGGAARAYPLSLVREAGVLNDVVGGRPVVVAASGDTAAAYDRRIDGRARWFRADGGGRMRAAGSRWAVASGRATSGPHEGTRLDRVDDLPPLYWFSWLDFHPDTTVYGRPALGLPWA